MISLQSFTIERIYRPKVWAANSLTQNNGRKRDPASKIENREPKPSVAVTSSINTPLTVPSTSPRN